MTAEERFARLEEILIKHDEHLFKLGSQSSDHAEQMLELRAIAAGQEERIRQNEIQIIEMKELNKQVAKSIALLVEHAQNVEERLDDLHTGQQHTDQRLDALIDIVQQKLN